MPKAIVIHKADSKHVRHIKKKLRGKIKRKFLKKRKRAISSIRKSLYSFIEHVNYFCAKNSIQSWGLPKKTIKIQNNCTLYDNPNTVLRTLLDLLHFAKYYNAPGAFPRLKCIGEISFGAMYLIDSICWEIGEHRVWKLELDNMREEDKQIFSELKSFRSYNIDTTCKHIINEKVNINLEQGASDQSYRVVAKSITDMVENAIAECNNCPSYELTWDESHAIYSTIGEHFDNIKQHAIFAKSGIICGFYDKINKVITILIFNFGRTIAESLSVSEIPEDMRKSIEQVIINQTKNNSFISSSNFTRENSLTLLALQEGISSKISDDKTRGHGLTDFLEYCTLLGSGTKIVVISGKTAIKIDGQYKVEPKNVLGRERRVIALNDENDIFKKPNSRYVNNLSYFFPGVIIETTIPLNRNNQ